MNSEQASAEPWTIARVLRWAAEDFGKRGIPSARLDAELLLSKVLGLDRVRLLLESTRPLTDEELAEYVAFAESDAGRWFVATQRKGLLDAMRTAMDAAARQMAAAFPTKR